MLVSLKKRLRNNTSARRIYGYLFATARKLHEKVGNTRERVLFVSLTLVFYVVLTPLALARRLLGRKLPPPEAQRGWQKIDQRSSARDMFERRF